MTQSEAGLAERLTATRSRRIAVLFIGILLFAGVAFATTQLTTDPYHVTNGTQFDAPDGPWVTIGDDVVKIDRSYPVTEDSVNLLPAARFTGDAGVFVNVSGLEDDWLNATTLSLNGGSLTIEPGDDRPTVTVSGEATHLAYRNYQPDDGNADLRLTTVGETTITLTGLPDADYLLLANDTHQLDRATITDGEATVTTDDSGDLFLQTADVSFEPDPEDGAFVDQQTDIPLNVTVGHPAFAEGDAVDITFYDAADDSEIGNGTLTEAGEASTVWSVELLGEHQWYAEANDSGVITTSDTWTFETPHNLTIRDEQTAEIIKGEDIDVEVQFFPEGEDDEVITRETSDGNVSLAGLPHDVEIIVRTSTENYFTRETIIRDLAQQMDVFLLNETADSVQVRFRLEDATGDFPEGESRILISKAISLDSETRYQNIVGQEFGIGGAEMFLEADQRYRITVEGPDGQLRSLGSFTPTADATHTLQIESRAINLAPPETDIGFRWDADYDEDLGDHGSIEVAFTDEEGLTESLTITVHERGNESNVLYEVEHGEVSSLLETIPINEENQNVSAWTVTLSGTHDGDDFAVSTVVDVALDLDLPIPSWVTSFVSFMLVLLVAGLFGGVRADLGAVVASVLAMLLWQIGFMPGSVTGVFVTLAVLVALAYRHGIGQQQGGVPR